MEKSRKNYCILSKNSHQRVERIKMKGIIFLAKSLSLMLLLSTCHIPSTRGSGVFELELVNLQQIHDSTNRVNEQSNNIAEHNSTNSSQHQAIKNSNESTSTSNIVRIFVCLKEAFTSKLDGPCTFGNASITLNRDSIQLDQATSATRLQANHDHNQAPIAKQGASLQQQQQQHQLTQGSLMTNIVRILFTFRWTKSFTIILTAEQIDVDNQQPLDQSQNHHLAQETTGQRRRGATNINKTNPSELHDSERSQPRDHMPSINGGSKFRFIDRHVSTENEVLPNLEPNPNKPWVSRFSRSLKSSLSYRFRIYCSLNYYGDGCTTFCRSRDDQFGHYNCSSTGQKVCLDGWHGPDCDKAQCRSGCSQQHGYCEKPDTCQCRPGWTGLRCDECITYPGCRNGYCLSPWQCICQRNWGGFLCDLDLNYCGTHEPCKNNGTCQNIAPGKYKCNCPEGFTGVDCDINLDTLKDTSKMTQLSAGCALNPCLNGGTCFGFNSAPVDYARELKTNETLDSVNDNDNDNDNEHTERIYRCQCAPGWTGDYCQWPDNNPMSVTTLLTIPIQIDNKTNWQQANTTEDVISDLTATKQLPALEGNPIENDRIVSPNDTTDIRESMQKLIQSPHLSMKHLISGVVIASVLGVFLASLLLAWCCLLAIERNKLPFIQMNIIRNSGDRERGLNEPVVSSTLRRMHGKIRDSLRLPTRSSRIKPGTNLSIENVLRPPRPPPSYEESSNYEHANRISNEYPNYHRY